MSELSLELLRFDEGLMKKCEVIVPIIEMTYNRRCRIDDLAPNRTLGVIAAYEYNRSKEREINTAIAVPAFGIMIIALCLAVVAWAVR